jgi:hypothetical protein
MDDVQALQRTVRRVGAVLVVALARIGYEITEFGALWAVLLGGGAVLYLVVSFFVQYVDTAAPDHPAENEASD